MKEQKSQNSGIWRPAGELRVREPPARPPHALCAECEPGACSLLRVSDLSVPQNLRMFVELCGVILTKTLQVKIICIRTHELCRFQKEIFRTARDSSHLPQHLPRDTPYRIDLTAYLLLLERPSVRTAIQLGCALFVAVCVTTDVFFFVNITNSRRLDKS